MKTKNFKKEEKKQEERLQKMKKQSEHAPTSIIEAIGRVREERTSEEEKLEESVNSQAEKISKLRNLTVAIKNRITSIKELIKTQTKLREKTPKERLEEKIANSDLTVGQQIEKNLELLAKSLENSEKELEKCEADLAAANAKLQQTKKELSEESDKADREFKEKQGTTKLQLKTPVKEKKEEELSPLARLMAERRTNMGQDKEPEEEEEGKWDD